MGHLLRITGLVILCLLACGPEKTSSSESSGTSSDTATGTATTDSATTDSSEPTAGVDEPCPIFCAKLSTCELDGGFEGCPCDPGTITGPKCLAAWQKTAACFDAATCEVLDEGEGPCWSEFQAAYKQCLFGEDGCEIYNLLGGPDDGTCTFGEDCVDAPTKQVKCDATTCTCTIDDEQVGTCPADNVCDTLEDLEARIAACCTP